MTGPWTKEHWPRALPLLVGSAQKRQTITYGDLATRLGVHHRPIRYLLGYIRDQICRPPGLPFITAIVVKGQTRLPGESFLPQGTDDLSKQEYRREFERLRDEVFAYPGWDDLLAELGLEPVTKTSDDFAEEARQYLKYQERQGGTGEGPEHERLKEFVAKHPKLLGLPAQMQGTQEEPLLSGDRCDVVFHWDSKAAVVEVKRGERGELVQGIYQAIKYRAVLSAQEGQGDSYPVRAFLVAYRIPDDLTDYAKRFDITCVSVSEEQTAEGT